MHCLIAFWFHFHCVFCLIIALRSCFSTFWCLVSWKNWKISPGSFEVWPWDLNFRYWNFRFLRSIWFSRLIAYLVLWKDVHFLLWVFQHWLLITSLSHRRHFLKVIRTTFTFFHEPLKNEEGFIKLRLSCLNTFLSKHCILFKVFMGTLDLQ